MSVNEKKHRKNSDKVKNLYRSHTKGHPKRPSMKVWARGLVASPGSKPEQVAMVEAWFMAKGQAAA